MFAMVCLQIAHPEIYQLFADNPNFREWDEELAYRETQKKEETDANWEKNFAQASTTDNFDTEWERCLFRVCYLNPRRRSKATSISQFISLFDEEFDKQTDVIKLIETALGQTAVTSVSSKENPNIRPPKGSYQRFYVSGYDAWISSYKEKHNMELKYPDFPLKETENTIKAYLDFLKATPYDAVDFDQSKSMDEQGSDYVLKYAGGISIYFKKKKIGLIYAHRTAKGEFILLQSSKHPRHENAPLILTKSNIEFDHRRKIREVDEENKEIKGAWGFVDFMEAEIDPKEITLSNEVIKYLIDESAEARTVPDINKDLITEKDIQNYVESFKNKRKDSKDYAQAVSFLNNYFDDANKKKIDL
jgi:hypothetical protein